MPSYPFVRMDLLSPENIQRYQKEGFRILKLVPHWVDGGTTPDIVYVQLDGRVPAIPHGLLPLVVTHALALSQRAQGQILVQRIVIDLDRFLDIQGITTNDVWQVLTQRFA